MRGSSRLQAQTCVVLALSGLVIEAVASLIYISVAYEYLAVVVA